MARAFTTRSRASISFLLLVLTALLPSCGPATSSLIVQLRTADTHAPIVHAAVAADSLALGPSLQLGDIIEELKGRRVALTSRATTDATGTARLAHIPDRAIHLTLLDSQGRIPFMFLENAELPTDWRPLTDPLMSTPGIELRVLASPTARP